MRLTGKEIIDEKIITNYTEAGIQQQGIDLRLMEVREFGHIENIDGPQFVRNFNYDTIGIIPAEGKTKLPASRPFAMTTHPTTKAKGWKLHPGYYEIIFDEGCNMPNNRVMDFITRSSGVRCCVEVISGQFDAGFSTDHMGCFMNVYEEVFIEQHARIAQTRISTTSPVDDDKLYNGQWQGDKQRAQQK